MFGSDPPSVNTKLLNANRENADRMAQFSEDTLYDYENYRQGMSQYTTDLMQNVVGQQMQAFQQQLDQSNELFNLAKEDRAYYDQFYKPIEARVRQDAMEWDSVKNTQRDMGEAQANVSQAFDSAKRNQRQQLESYGVDPSMTRAQALDRGVDVAKAAAQASEANKAQDMRQQQGLAMRAGLANQGNLIANRALQTAGQGQQGSSSAARTGALTTGTANQTAGQNLGWIGQQGNQAGNVGQQYLDMNTDYLNQYNAELNQFGNTMQPGEVIAGLGSSVIGGAAGAGAFNPLIQKGMAKIGLAEGGVVPTPEEAGVAPVAPETVQGGIPTEDRTPTALTPGEFVIPDDTVRWKGEEYFHKEIQKAREAMQNGGPGAIPAGAAA